MKLTNASDFLLAQWYSIHSVISALGELTVRHQSAGVTGNRIKALTRGAYENVVYTFDDLPTEDFLPAGKYYLGESDSAFSKCSSVASALRSSRS